jgi:hypothetical protein
MRSRAKRAALPGIVHAAATKQNGGPTRAGERGLPVIRSDRDRRLLARRLTDDPSTPARDEVRQGTTSGLRRESPAGVAGALISV